MVLANPEHVLFQVRTCTCVCEHLCMSVPACDIRQGILLPHAVITHTHMHTHIHTHTHTRTHAHAHTHAHTHARTHTHAKSTANVVCVCVC